MLKTIYFGSRPLLLCTNADAAAAQFTDRTGLLIENNLTDENVVRMIACMQQPQTKAGIFAHTDTNALLQAFTRHMLLLQAGGGLVYTPEKTVLLIFRRGKWDLPKGKLDEGETLEACAVREVQEETGLKQITLQKPLTTTWHTYHQDGQLILKESHWYLMQTGKETALVPQLDEDIEQCLWVPVTGLEMYKQNTHPSILDVLKEGERELLQAAK